MTNDNNDNHTTPLHMLAEGRSGSEVLHMLAEGRGEEAVMTELLIANGAEVNAILNERASGWGPGWTPLDCAILKEHSGMQSLLRQHGGRCNKKCGRADKFGATQPRICLNSVAHCI